ncbi:PREDICTED: 2-oxoglutarate and iron-dependent oxygenase domain-containing protein 2 isoform X1 [Ceratotherium simum simum]|uniref:2-oxoglutarate and iron-dependent oxygenase domain-containing protein 2 isoform X1 n=1 Tax=Ceratotherium simum simum TaxID=73337 RepID=A0ABM1CSW2_CERSS|nr:PREDICTED: 2-oxoglutarate and iron-dependent oxygenase domain-containing protein 2 isoform X1 [Ceratotherium simum simum]
MATAGAPRRFCRCACFCSENLYVARYGLHLRFRGEQQLRQDYGPILRSRGCVSPEDFQQLLGELEQEVERRRQLGQESAARKALIARSYHPVRPELYSALQDVALAPEFLAAAEYSTSPGADLKGLLQRLETVSEEKRIYRLPVFTAPFCQALLEELEHFEQSDMPKGRPNTMNNYGVLLHELGLDEPLVTPLRERFLQPLMALLYPDCGGGWLDSHRAFVVKYALGQDRELGCHYDNAELTLNVALGKAFTGGALYFGGLFQVSMCGPGGRAWGSRQCPGLSPAVRRCPQPWPGPWRWSTWWARAFCTGAASCMGPGLWALASAGTSSSGSGLLLCATASAPCAAASLTWWTTRASATASPGRSPPRWMCVR